MLHKVLHLHDDFQQMKSVITVMQRKRAVKHQHERNLFSCYCMFVCEHVSVCITSVCRPVSEDLQRALIIIQNHLLARLVILLHRHENTQAFNWAPKPNHWITVHILILTTEKSINFECNQIEYVSVWHKHTQHTSKPPYLSYSLH